MLSKVLTGRGWDHIEAATFAPAGARHLPPQTGEQGGVPDDEVQGLRDRIRRLESELEAAKRDAFGNGFRQGELQARAGFSPVMERMNASIAECAGLRNEIRCNAEKDVVQLALLIARRVLHRELHVDSNALTALARVVFERLARAESYRVTVHPNFVAGIQAALPGHHAGRVAIEPDPQCAVGSFRIQSAEGLVDASVDSQLEEIGRGLTDRLAAPGGSR